MNAKQNSRRELYYITHVDNLESILRHGIYSHSKIEQAKIDPKKIYDNSVMLLRQARTTPSQRNLWEYANLYWQPRNPMLYRIKSSMSSATLAIIGVDREQVLKLPGIFITDGNAAHSESKIFDVTTGKDRIKDLKTVLTSDYWRESDGSKRKIMAEVLVPDFIPKSLIRSIYVPTHELKRQLSSKIDLTFKLDIIPEAHMFFMNSVRLSKGNLRLVEGDLFFSDKQTLTISVNTQGIMGKGLASRAKYQFPDAYVEYQRACQEQMLSTECPFLYKRENPLEAELSYDPTQAQLESEPVWFLFFATKQHWRNKSQLSWIENGLIWLAKNYKSLQIKSLAMPALGCGLGELSWEDVGPLMVRYLSQLDISVDIHLPLEHQLAYELLSESFLFSQT